MNIDHDLIVLGAKVAAAAHILGLLSAGKAIMTARTSQGAVAWAVALIAFPYVSLPLYWIFGRDRFWGYTIQRREKDIQIGHLRKDRVAVPPIENLVLAPELARGLEALVSMRFTPGNKASLLVDGQATFDAIFEGIDSAKAYLLVQFFIVKDDELGKAFKARLIAAANRGVRVYFLYDEVGSHALPKKYRQELREASVQILPFKTTKGAKNRFQINFRNHRKIVIVDGRVAFVGGHNVGDEYLGKEKKFGPWRDTHVRVAGPAVGQVQVAFLEDWHWSSGEVPSVNWDFSLAADPGIPTLVVPTSPADSLETCSLFFLQTINAAKKRIWITSPYFVPDLAITSALQLAAMRGVDVRIILPNMADHLMVYLASFSYLKDMLPWNVKLFRYQHGFLHEKVMLIDDKLASVGTANFDNRSFRLNFEITMLFADAKFCSEVEGMLEEDFRHSKPVTMAEITDRGIHFRVAVQVARLMAPIL